MSKQDVITVVPIEDVISGMKPDETVYQWMARNGYIEIMVKYKSGWIHLVSRIAGMFDHTEGNQAKYKVMFEDFNWSAWVQDDGKGALIWKNGVTLAEVEQGRKEIIEVAKIVKDKFIKKFATIAVPNAK